MASKEYAAKGITRTLPCTNRVERHWDASLAVKRQEVVSGLSEAGVNRASAQAFFEHAQRVVVLSRF